MQHQIIIIGAGPAGLSLAIGLTRLGYAVNVYEQRSKTQITKGGDARSVNITLSHRGMSRLKQIGCEDDVIRAAARVIGRNFAKESDNPRFVPYTLLPGNALYSIKRDMLESILIHRAEHVGIPIHYEFKLIALDSDKKHCQFTNDGQQHVIPYNFLFGADGAHSKVRELLRCQCTSSINDYVYKRIDIDQENGAMLGFRADAVNIIPGNSGMLLTLPNPDGGHSGLLHVKNSLIDEIESDANSLKRYFPYLYDHVSDFKDKFHNATIGVFYSIDCQRWFWRKNILLCGDSAHATVPFFGQGVNAGLEDTNILCSLIEDCKDLATAAAIFQQQRPQSTAAMSELSLQNLNNLDLKTDVEEYFTIKHLDLALEERFTDYHSQYYWVAFTSLPYERAKQLSEEQSNIVQAFVKRKNLKGQVNFQQELLDELYSEIKLANTIF